MAQGSAATTGSNAFYSQQYASAVELLAQQRMPKLVAACTPMTAVGKAATVVNLLGQVEADERTAIYDPIAFGNIEHTRPWVFPRHFDKALPFESIEQMQMNANPQSGYVDALVAAIHRKMDEEVIRALFADRLIGENGTTTESYSTNNDVGTNVGGTASGLNVQKLQKVLQLARIAEVDPKVDKLTIVISPVQETNMLDEMEAISSDFTVKRILDAGTIEGSGYMGFDWIISNKLTVASSVRDCPVFAKAGMNFTTWDGGLKTDISQRKDLRGHPWQAYTEGHFGAVRRDKLKVWRIKCTES